jgi:hypothetical protein
LGALGSEDFRLAQRFQIDAASEVTSVQILLELLTSEAEICLAIDSEFQGQPAESALPGSEVVRRSSVAAEAEKASTPAFVEFKFPSPLALQPGHYWIVLSAPSGQLTWRINDAQPNTGSFVYTRLDGSARWIQRRHPTTGKAVSGIYKMSSLVPDTTNLMGIDIGGMKGLLMDIRHPVQIDQDLTALVVNGHVTSLASLLNKLNFQTFPAFTFPTSATGSLNISDLHIAFDV